MEPRNVLEKLGRLLDVHPQNLVNVLAFVLHLERFTVEALALADVAFHVHRGKKVHLDGDHAVALAVLAAAALHVEAETSRLVAAHARVLGGRKEIANKGPCAHVGRGIRARRPADRRLVDVDDAVQILEAEERLMLPRLVVRAVEDVRRRFVEHVIDERALAGTGNARDRGHAPERDRDVDVLEVVRRGAFDAQKIMVF